MNKSRIQKLITSYKERYPRNYFKLEQKKKEIKAVFLWLLIFFYKKDFLKVSFVIYYPIARYWRLVGQNKFGIFLNNGVVVGKKNLDSSWSRYCCWQNNFLLFLIHILLNLDLSCLHISNGFYQRKSSKFFKVTKIMPNKKSHLFLKFDYT